MNHGFILACGNGQIEIAKWLVRNHPVNVHLNDEWAFKSACRNGHIEIAKWLLYDYQVDVRANNNTPFKWACEGKATKIIEWFVNEYKYSQSPYYYHNQTAYILNQEPLKEWKSCIILGYSVAYRGELDEPAVIAYMATLKRPKSARS